MIDVNHSQEIIDGRKYYRVIINGILDRLSPLKHELQKDQIRIREKEIVLLIHRHSFNEIPDEIKYLEIPATTSFDFLESEYFRYYPNRKMLELDLAVDLNRWNKPYTFEQFKEEIEFIYESKYSNKLRFNHYDGMLPLDQLMKITKIDRMLSFDLNVEFLNENIGEKQKEFESVVSSIIEKALERTISKHSIESLVTFFEFPDHIKSICHQYLIYFTQFLSDVGIQAKASITEDASRTLFMVIPNNPKEALIRIAEALNIYLRLPEEPEIEIIGNKHHDIGVSQLVANIHHLKSQLILANAAAANQTVIDNQNLIIYQYKQLIQSNKSQTKNEEEIAGGLIKINDLQGKGFSINLPEILRKIKRKFNL